MRLLAVDSGSPTTSVAVGEAGAVGVRGVEQRRTSELLLATIEALLAERGLELGELDGLVGLAGPGSFTGLRIGLATLYGLHQATGVPATALPTLAVLAASVDGAGGGDVVAAVDSLRGEWLAGRYRDGRAVGAPRLVTAGELLAVDATVVVGCGVTALGADPRLVEPPPLAPVALALASRVGVVWDAALLTRPLYARPPATTPPRPPKAVGATSR